MFALGRKTIRYAVILLAVLLCVGCSSQEKKSGQAMTSDAPRTIKRELSSNLIVDAKVEAPPMDIVKDAGVWEAGYITYDAELVKKTLLKNTEVTKEESYPRSVSYSTKDNTILGIGTSVLSYYTRFYEYESNVFDNDPSSSSYNADLYKGQDFSFASRKQAEETVRGELRKLGIENLGTATIYCLDYKTMQQQEELAKKDEVTQEFAQMGKVFFKNSWSAEDNCYYMLFDCTVDGLPVYPLTEGQSSYSMHSNYVKVLYTAKGIQQIEAIDLYHPTEKVKAATVMDVETALGWAKDKFDELILTTPMTITNIKLQYMPVSQNKEKTSIKLVPCWAFAVETKLDTTMETDDGQSMDLPDTFTSWVYFDAETGQELQ